jgi:sodium/bile acid cotransporter 7
VVRPFPAIWAAFISYGPLPALAWGLGHVLPLEDFRVGLMITASVPCTLASAVLWTRMAGGDEASALLSTLLTTGLSWLATTGWLTLTTGSNVQLDTAGMMGSLAVVLVLPVGVGQLARALGSVAGAADRWKTPLSVFSRLLVIIIMFRAAVEVRERLAGDGVSLGVGMLLLTAGVCIGTHLLALYLGIGSGRLLGMERASRIAVAFAGSQKTLPVSLFLFERYFREYPLAVVPMAFYHVGQLVVDTFIADAMARDAKEPPVPEAALDSEGLP